MQPDANPEPILQLLTGYVGSQFLFTAHEIGLFEALAEGPADLEALAQRTGVPRRPLEIVADGMAALAIVDKEEDQYQNTPEATTFLSGKTPADLGPLVRFNREVVYRDLANFGEAVREGAAAASYPSGEKLRWYSEGIAVQSTPQAQALAADYEFDRHERVLDLGGGIGVFVEAVLREHEDVEATLFDRPQVIEFARERLARSLNGQRLQFVEGDFFEDPIPAGHDAFILASIVHNFPPGANRRLLRRIREQAADGARMLLVDFWTDPTHTEPPFAALLAALLYTYSEGGAYSVEEGKSLLAESGWKTVDHRPLGGPASVLIAEVD